MLPSRKDLSAAQVRALLDYCPETGVFRWRERAGSEHEVICWNPKWAGKIAGYIDKRGYRRIKINATYYAAHRLAWIYVTGEWPTLDLDHKMVFMAIIALPISEKRTAQKIAPTRHVRRTTRSVSRACTKREATTLLPTALRLERTGRSIIWATTRRRKRRMQLMLSPLSACTETLRELNRGI